MEEKQQRCDHLYSGHSHPPGIGPIAFLTPESLANPSLGK